MSNSNEKCCDHEWEFEDDSFDHAFGTEQVHYWLCTKCESVTEDDPFVGCCDEPDEPDYDESDFSQDP